jgi:DNA-binding Xre family transcriptional regulator
VRAIRFSTLEAICTAPGCRPGGLLEFKTGAGAIATPTKS